MTSPDRDESRPRSGWQPDPDAQSLPPVFHAEQRLRFAVVAALTGWGRSKLYSEIRAGRFPSPERDSTRCSRWRAGDVLAALQARRQAVPCHADHATE